MGETCDGLFMENRSSFCVRGGFGGDLDQESSTLGIPLQGDVTEIYSLLSQSDLRNFPFLNTPPVRVFGSRKTQSVRPTWIREWVRAGSIHLRSGRLAGSGTKRGGTDLPNRDALLTT